MDATTYKFYCTESFLDHLLESSKFWEESYQASEGVLIRGTGAIWCLVREIVGTLTMILPNRDFKIGFFERFTRDPVEPVV